MVLDKEKKTKESITQGYIRNTEKIKFVILEVALVYGHFKTCLIHSVL